MKSTTISISKIVHSIFIGISLLSSVSIVSACDSIWPYKKVEATEWVVVDSKITSPDYTNLDEYTLIYRDSKSEAVCGPNAYYVRKSLIVPLVIAAVVILIFITLALINIRRKRLLNKG